MNGFTLGCGAQRRPLLRWIIDMCSANVKWLTSLRHGEVCGATGAGAGTGAAGGGGGGESPFSDEPPLLDVA